MAEERIQTGKAPLIEVVECVGDLAVRSWMDTAVLLKGAYEVTETESGLSMRATGDLSMMVPAETAVTVQHAVGDTLIKNLAGAVSVQEVSGDLLLVNTGAAKVGTVHGDVSARSLSGSIVIEAVHGDVAVRNVEGDVAADHIYGDVAVRNVTGSVDLNQVMGDASLKTINGDLSLKEGYRDVNLKNLGGRTAVGNVHGDIRLQGGLSAADHVLTAEGDIVVRWPLDAPLNLMARAPKIQNRLPLVDVMEEEGMLSGRLEDGKTSLTLTAGGRISLKDAQMIDSKWDLGEDVDMEMEFEFDTDFAGLGERIGAQIRDQMARVTQDIETRFGPDYAQRMAEKVARRAERAAERAERAASRARAPQPPPPPPAPQAPAAPQRKSASPEEQLKILKMVEQGRITPDEANILLKALEE